jgi:hypothetical protein
MDQKDAYLYENQIQNIAGARVRIIPGMTYVAEDRQQGYTPYLGPISVAGSFIENVQNSQTKPDIEDFFQKKVELSGDRVGLILGEIKGRESLNYDNLVRLYHDLFRIDQWRAEIPFPQNYLKDKAWSDLNRMELQIREQVRREAKDFARDTAFPTKDLREGLLEFKLQNQKSKMMDIGGLDDVIEPAGSYKNTERDMHYNQKPTY